MSSANTTSLAALASLGAPAQASSATSKASMTAHVSWFVLGALIAFVILYLLKPSVVRQKVNGEVTASLDTTRLIVASLVVGLVVAVVAWLLRGCGKHA